MSTRIVEKDAWCKRVASVAASHALQEQLRGLLVEHLVQVPALRALDAGGAAVRARAPREQVRRVRDPPREAVEPTLGDADAARVAVVDEHGGEPGLEVEVRREAADVPAVAHRPEW